MNRTDRMLGVLLELQARRHTRAEDLAKRFETSKRTIYRDIQGLCETGVPVVSTPGLGYALAPGYFLPPLSFTQDEATMLMLGAGFMAQSFDAQYQEAARAAVQKIDAVLKPDLRGHVRKAAQRIRFAQTTSGPEERLPALRRAVLERRTLRFRYRTRYSATGEPEVNERAADPYALIFWMGYWYVPAYCHLRESMRYFRADRMSDLEVLETVFTPRPGTGIESFERVEELERERPIRVRVAFGPESVPWVKENRSWFTTGMEESGAGLVVTLQVTYEREILPWILSWGSQAEVLEPGTLRCRVTAEARKILSRSHGC